MNKVQDDEIDLFQLFETLWDGKWKIIATTFVAFVVGIVFSVFKPNSFEVSTPVKIAKQSVFFKYVPINNILKQTGLYSDKPFNDIGYRFDPNSVFKNFVIEFNDYKEMVGVLSKDEFVKQKIKELDDREKQRALIGLAKNFKIVPPVNKEKNWHLKFLWHDFYEGRSLFKKAIEKTLINIQNTSKSNLKELAKAIDNQNAYKLETLQNNLNVIKQGAKTALKKRILFLNEQYSIATELGIETNKLNTSELSQNGQNQISFNINQNDGFSYYLRGYKAIKKEIELIESRSEQDNLLMVDASFELINKIALIKSDKTSAQLRNALKFIERDNAKDWVVFDMELADAKSQNKTKLYIAFSIVLGGILGVIFVLVSKAFQKRKGKLSMV